MLRSQARRGLARTTRSAPTSPRAASKTPTTASNGATHSKGTREIATITDPRSTSEVDRVQFSPRETNFAGLKSPRAPQRTKITLTANQPSERRSKKICFVAPSQTTRPPKKKNNNSTITRSKRSLESIPKHPIQQICNQKGRGSKLAREHQIRARPVVP